MPCWCVCWTAGGHGPVAGELVGLQGLCGVILDHMAVMKREHVSWCVIPLKSHEQYLHVQRNCY